MPFIFPDIVVLLAFLINLKRLSVTASILKRNFGLDLLRAISIWLVLLQHAGVNIPGMRPLKIGGIGVEIFFVLSGFLIGGILFKELDKQNSLKETLKNFWVRRWFRILPLYYAMLAFKFIFIDDSIGWNILYYIFFLQNNFYGIGFMEVSWSLVIEEWFYLFTPIFLFLVLRMVKSQKGVILSIVGFIALVVLLRTVYVYTGNVSFEGVNSNFPFRFDSLFIGVLLAYLRYNKIRLFDTLAQGKYFLLGLFGFCSYIYYYWTLAYPDNLVNETYFPRTAGFFILPFTVGLLIPYISAGKFSFRNFSIGRRIASFISWTSILTYAIYLIHPMVYVKFIHLEGIDSYFLRFALCIALTYLFAWLVYRFFERPILSYRDRISPR